jgi:hypothetical protein
MIKFVLIKICGFANGSNTNGTGITLFDNTLWIFPGNKFVTSLFHSNRVGRVIRSYMSNISSPSTIDTTVVPKTYFSNPLSLD